MTNILDQPSIESRTEAPATTEQVGKPTGSVRLRRRVAGVAIIAAGAISLAGFRTAPWEHGSDTASYLRSLTSAPTQAIISSGLPCRSRGGGAQRRVGRSISAGRLPGR